MKKSKIFISLICALLLVCSSAFSVSAFASDDEVSKRVDEIVEEVLSGPERYNFDDIIYVFENDGAAARKILNHIDEVAIPAEETIDYSSFENNSAKSAAVISVPTGNAVEYAPQTKTVTISYADDLPTVEVQEETDELPDLLSNSFPGMIFPDPFSEFSVNANVPPESGFIYPDITTMFKLYTYSQVNSKIYEGTGFKISDKYIATAGHLVYDPITQNNIADDGIDFVGWAGNILCIPASEVGKNDPIQSYAVNSNMAVGETWYSEGNPSDDWGVIQMRNPIRTGIMQRRKIDNPSSFVNEYVTMAGFPGSRLNIVYSTGKNEKLLVNSNTVMLSTFSGVSGQSGGPVTDGNGEVVGIYSGVEDNTGYGAFVMLHTTLYNRFDKYS